MTLITLPTPIYSRRYSTLFLDAAGRLVVYELAYRVATNDYDPAFPGGVTERFDPGTNTWTSLPQSAQHVQTATTAGWWVDAAYRFTRVAGVDPPFVGRVDTTETFNSLTETWSTGPVLPPAPRSQNIAWYDTATDTAWTGGGWTAGSVDQLDLYRLSGGSWVATTSAPATFGTYVGGVYGSTSTAHRDSAGRYYFIGSPTASTHFQRFTPATETWETLIDSPTINTNAVMGADKLYVLSRTVEVPVINPTLYEYDVLADTWTALSQSPTPANGPLIYDAGLNAVFLPGGEWLTHVPNVFHLDPVIYKFDIATAEWSATDDQLSTARGFAHNGSIAFDGVGYYLGQGADGDANAVNVVDYWTPVRPIVVSGRSYAQILG